ncbi:protein PilN (plasmid) [Cupriavidus necator]|uniref:Protein PilN n=1 Tax=Cupriavidus necator TaxID=106590 RepID=A0A1U9V3K8_CUPNE|nr:protein PilN [Cupriavidus necator]AQV99473.1 protein PilN [Cupriavidus necator]
MKLIRLLHPTAGAVLVCSTLAGCVSPQLQRDTRQAADDARASFTGRTESLYAQMRRDRAAVEAEQDVSKPYLVGKPVPTARNVTLPLALRHNVDTWVMFPERVMPLAVAAQRITMATGIPVKIESDVYLPANLLMPRSLMAQAGGQLRSQTTSAGANPMTATGLGPAPTTNGPLPGALLPGGASPSAASQTTPLIESALSVEFKSSEKMPLANMLDLIATRLGLNWEYNASKGVIRFYRLTTKMWQLPMKAGTSSFTTEFKQSAQGSSNGAMGGGGQATQIDAAVKSEAKELDDMDGIRKSIEPALTMVGRAELNPATGILTLKDTKEAVDAADEIVRKQVAIYSRMVYFKFQTIDWTVTDNGEAGVDWNAVLTKALEHVPGFTFTALSPASLVSSSAGSFGLGITSGGWNGTKAIVDALKQYGTVTTSVTIPMALRNRHGAQYNNRRQFTYVSSTTPASTTAGGTGGIPGITTSTGSVGFKLTVFPDATTRDDVNLTLAFDQSALDGPIQTFTSGSGNNQQSVQVPRIVAKGIPAQDFIVRNGQTVVVTAFDQTDSQLTHRTLGEYLPTILGGSLTATKSRTFTLVLATVMVQDQGEAQ